MRVSSIEGELLSEIAKKLKLAFGLRKIGKRFFDQNYSCGDEKDPELFVVRSKSNQSRRAGQT